jgi:outer membrane protein, heavy metal efflux system
MKRIIFQAVIAFAVSGLHLHVLHGQEKPQLRALVDASTGTSVEELIGIALSRNSSFLASKQGLPEAQGLAVQAGLRPNPGLDVSLTNGSVLGSAGERGFGFGYGHVFELGGKRNRRLEVAVVGTELATLDIAERERSLRFEIRAKFAEALAAFRNFEISESLLQLNRRSLQIAQARYQQGEAPQLEPGLLKVEVSRIQSDLLLFENQVRRALADLKVLAGIDPTTELKIKGTLGGALVTVSEQDALQKAIKERPDLQAAIRAQSLGESELRLAQSEAVPNLTAFGRYAQSTSQFDQSGLAQNGGGLQQIRDVDNTLTVGLSLNLPVRNRNQGNIQAAVARQRAARLRRAYAEQSVVRDVRNAFTRYEASLQATKIFDQDVLQQAQSNVSILRAAYDAGELRLLDVINEQRRLIDTQKAYTDVLREAYLSLVDLERAVGSQLF